MEPEKKDVLTAIHNIYCCSISICFRNARMPMITDRLVIFLNCYDNFYTSGAYFHYLAKGPTTLRAGTAPGNALWGALVTLCHNNKTSVFAIK